MLKANGYGHGANWVATQLAEQAQGFGLARLSEALALRDQFPHTRLLLLGTLVDTHTLIQCAQSRIDLIIHRREDAEQLAATVLPAPISVWLKRNLGMNRLGMNHDDFCSAHRLLADHPNVSGLVHMGHFSDAESSQSQVSDQQAQRLLDSSRSLGKYSLSLANSAAIINHPQHHQHWQRPGIMLYGDDPTHSLKGQQALQAVMQFKSRVIAINNIEAGEGVGYNRRWQASETRRIATIGAGYADGYPRHAADGTPLLIGGKRASLAGRVSMDLLTADITELPTVKVGDEVTLWGKGLSAGEVASHCDTISYELFTQVTGRVERIYG